MLSPSTAASPSHPTDVLTTALPIAHELRTFNRVPPPTLSGTMWQAASPRAIGLKLLDIDPVRYDGDARSRSNTLQQGAILLGDSDVQGNAPTPAALHFFRSPGLVPKIRAPPLAPLDGRAPLEKGRFHVVVHADDGNATARGQGTGQVPQAVDVDEIESLRSQQVGEPRVIGMRIVPVCRIDPPQRDAPEVIPYISEPVMPLWNGKHLDGCEPAQRVATRGDIPSCAFARCRRALETERRDVERASQETEDMVRPDPHAAIRRVGQRLAQEEEFQIPHRALQA